MELFAGWEGSLPCCFARSFPETWAYGWAGEGGIAARIQNNMNTIEPFL